MTVIARLLGAAGLAPASEVARLNDNAQKAEGRVAHLERQLEQARSEAQGWKRRVEESAEAIAGWKQATHRAQAETEQLKKEYERVKSELERTKNELEREQPRTVAERRRAEALKTELIDIRSRVEHAHQVTDSANEQLMAMEVKLDLLEAAIHVLDMRTREQALSASR